MLFGEVDLHGNAAQLKAQTSAEAALAPCPPCGDLVEDVGCLDTPILELRPACGAYADHVAWPVDPAAFGPRDEVEAFEVRSAVFPRKGGVTDLALPGVLLE